MKKEFNTPKVETIVITDAEEVLTASGEWTEERAESNEGADW